MGCGKAPIWIAPRIAALAEFAGRPASNGPIRLFLDAEGTVRHTRARHWLDADDKVCR